MKIEKVRDLTLIELEKGSTLVITCDSCGGIGLKEGDVLKVPPEVTGRYAARVVLLEVLCAGAEVVCLANAVCNEMKPTGQAVIRGIRAELELAEIEQVVLTGSTEENFATFATGLGITAVGVVETARLRVNRCRAGLTVVAVGAPLVGEEVLQAQLVGYCTIRELLAHPGVYEMVPVGSKGILAEAKLLAACHELTFIPEQAVQIDMKKSAGPNTVILAAVDERFLAKPVRHAALEVIGGLAAKK